MEPWQGEHTARLAGARPSDRERRPTQVLAIDRRELSPLVGRDAGSCRHGRSSLSGQVTWDPLRAGSAKKRAISRAKFVGQEARDSAALTRFSPRPRADGPEHPRSAATRSTAKLTDFTRSSSAATSIWPAPSQHRAAPRPRVRRPGDRHARSSCASTATVSYSRPALGPVALAARERAPLRSSVASRLRVRRSARRWDQSLVRCRAGINHHELVVGQRHRGSYKSFFSLRALSAFIYIFTSAAAALLGSLSMWAYMPCSASIKE